ncbi:hypothetical protein Tco_1547605 [Tanacetum coccineum]
MYRSTQAMHMLKKPQVFYDDTHKQALAYQNPFHLKKAQRIKPKIYDGSVIAKEHAVIFVIDDEETLILEEENRSKMLDKQNDLILVKQIINISPIDYSKLNHLKEDFDEITEIQTVFNQMKAVVDQCFIDKNTFEIEKKELKLENERFLEHIICQDVVNIVMHADVNVMEKSYIEEYEKNLKLAAELSQMNELLKTCSRHEQRCISLELELQHKKESFQNDKPCENRDALEFGIINELKAQLQAKDTTIDNLKKHIQELKGKSMFDCSDSVNKSKVIALSVLKLDLEPLSSNLKNNREAHVDYIRITRENAYTLRGIVKQARISNPLDNALAYAYMYTKQIQELLVYVSDTCPNSPLKSEKLLAVTPVNKARKVTFAKTSTTSENNTQKRVDLHKT